MHRNVINVIIKSKYHDRSRERSSSYKNTRCFPRARWKIVRINIQPLEDIVYIKRRFAMGLGKLQGYSRSYEWPHFGERDLEKKNIIWSFTVIFWIRITVHLMLQSRLINMRSVPGFSQISILNMTIWKYRYVMIIIRWNTEKKHLNVWYSWFKLIFKTCI